MRKETVVYMRDEENGKEPLGDSGKESVAEAVIETSIEGRNAVIEALRAGKSDRQNFHTGWSAGRTNTDNQA